MLPSTPRVTVVLPAYNAAATLEQAVASVQAQSFTDWELRIVDDGSSDATSKIAQRFADVAANIFFDELPANQGVAAARNLAIAAARGRYIAFLDADDAWWPNKLDHQIALMERTGAALSYTGFNRVSKNGSRPVQVPQSTTYEALLRGNVICCSTAIYDSAICGKTPMPAFHRRQDYALWLDLLKTHHKAHGLNEILLDYHVVSNSLSNNKLVASLGTWRVYRAHLGFSRKKALACLLSHSFNRIRRG